jgi:hypothetical protein
MKIRIQESPSSGRDPNCVSGEYKAELITYTKVLVVLGLNFVLESTTISRTSLYFCQGSSLELAVSRAKIVLHLRISGNQYRSAQETLLSCTWCQTNVLQNSDSCLWIFGRICLRGDHPITIPTPTQDNTKQKTRKY